MPDDTHLILEILQRLDTRMDGLEKGQTVLIERMDRLETGQISLRVDVMERMDRLQNTLTGIRDDIATNFGTADHVRRANDNTRDELRALADAQMAMLRQIQRLQTDVREMRGDP